MVLSSHVALNKVDPRGITELKRFISRSLDSSVAASNIVKPTGLHFCLAEKIFIGTDQPFIQCPINFVLRDQSSSETQLCRPVWTESKHRSKVNRKARLGVKKLSVIRLDDFSVVAHKQALDGYVFFVRNYHVVKKDIDNDAYQRWIME